jgi:transposase
VATDSEDSKPANHAGVTTDFIRPFLQKPPLQLPAPKLSTSDCEPFRETIELGLSRGRNAMAIWQDLVSDHGFSGAYNTVKRFVRKRRGSKRPEAVGIIVTAPGEEAQVDYGTGPMVRDPHTGKYRRTRLFVMMLGYSRKAVRLLVFRSSTRTWAELQETAFRRLGGSCRVLVLDNLKEGVLTPDIYDPTLNPLMKDVLTHYGVVAMPCRVRDPDRKDQASYCTSSDIFDASLGNWRRSRNRLPGCAWGKGPVGG